MQPYFNSIEVLFFPSNYGTEPISSSSLIGLLVFEIVLLISISLLLFKIWYEIKIIEFIVLDFVLIFEIIIEFTPIIFYIAFNFPLSNLILLIKNSLLISLLSKLKIFPRLLSKKIFQLNLIVAFLIFLVLLIISMGFQFIILNIYISSQLIINIALIFYDYTLLSIFTLGILSLYSKKTPKNIKIKFIYSFFNPEPNINEINKNDLNLVLAFTNFMQFSLLLLIFSSIFSFFDANNGSFLFLVTLFLTIFEISHFLKLKSSNDNPSLKPMSINYQNKIYEEAFIESELRYKVLIEENNFGISMIKEGKVIYANKQFENIMKYPMKKIINRSLDKLISTLVYDEDIPLLKKQFNQVENRAKNKEFNLIEENHNFIDFRILKDEFRRNDIKFNTKDYRALVSEAHIAKEDLPWKWVRHFIQIMPMPSETILQSWIMDVTNEKIIKSELDELRRREGIERIQHENDRKLALIAGGIAHDFNNILTKTLAYLEMIKRDFIPIEKQKKMIEESYEASLRMKHLVSQLLNFSKGEPPILNKEDVISIVSDSANFILSGSKSRVIINSSDDKIYSKVDLNQFSQVLNNIFINADQAMPHGGTIKINIYDIYKHPEILEYFSNEKENLETSANLEELYNIIKARDNDYILIEIKDEGIGIPDYIKDRIFQPYFTTKSGGSGLGLMISKRIIENHYGEIWFKSNVGKGTVFYILLPGINLIKTKTLPTKKEGKIVLRNSAEMNSAIINNDEGKRFDNLQNKIKKLNKSRALNEQYAHKKMEDWKILIMDDDENVAEALTLLLKTIGIPSIDYVYDAVKCIKYCKREKEFNNYYDVLILDVTIRGGIGAPEIIKQLRKITPNSIFVVTSGYSKIPVIEKYKEYNFDCLLKKPYTISDLYGLLDKIKQEKAKREIP